MTSGDPFVDLGEPQLAVAGLRLWVHGWEFEQAVDFDDANWLRITAHCSANGSRVWTDGPILQAPDIQRFGDECSRLLRGESDRAELAPLEPNLHIAIERVDRTGHLMATVVITVETSHQAHSIQFEIDQSYLPGIVTGCASILRSFPVRGTRPGGSPAP